MSINTDWMEKDPQALLEQASATCNHARTEPHRTRMGFAPGTPAGIFLDHLFAPALAGFETALRARNTSGAPVPSAGATFMEAMKILRAAYGALYSGLIKCNPAVTAADRIAMKIPVHDPGHDHAMRPRSRPDVSADTSVPLAVTLRFADSVTGAETLPDGICGAEIRWQVFGTVKEIAASQLENMTICASSPLTVNLQESQRGKLFYFSMRWLNSRARGGLYSEPRYVIIL